MEPHDRTTATDATVAAASDPARRRCSVGYARTARSRTVRSEATNEGLALLDVLLGMAIFSLIVVISIQSVGRFRQRAFQTSSSCQLPGPEGPGLAAPCAPVGVVTRAASLSG